jgi:hypothetical protein
MALDVDTTQALRRPADLLALVHAITKAHSKDEPDWLEWKSTLDLLSAEGRFHVVRTILALANRVPDRAAQWCQGVGYLVVGAEPGNVSGVAEVDPAVLDDKVSPYLGGARGPAWNPTYVAVDGKHVLVIAVEPPRRGDPIFTLRKAGPGPKGAVYVRKPGKTTPADDADLDALQERLKAPTRVGLELEVSVVGDLPLSWFDPSQTPEEIDAWVEQQRAELIAAAEATERLREDFSTPNGTTDPRETLAALAQRRRQLEAGLTSMHRALHGTLTTEDTRSLDDYVEEVEEWAKQLEQIGPDLLLPRFLDGRNAVRLAVRNPTDRNLADVQVRAHFPGEFVKALDDPPEIPGLPVKPHPYREPKLTDPMRGVLDRIVPTPYLPADLFPDVTPRRLWIEDGSINLTWDVGDLRPYEEDESEEFHVVLVERPADGFLTGTWEATSKTVDGVVRGILTAPVIEQPLTAADLFD